MKQNLTLGLDIKEMMSKQLEGYLNGGREGERDREININGICGLWCYLYHF